MRRIPFCLHKNTSVPKTGNVLELDEDVNKVILNLSGTATSFTVVFEASMDGVNYGPYGAIELGDYVNKSAPTVLNTLYQFEPEGIPYFRINVKNVSNGYIDSLAYKIYNK